MTKVVIDTNVLVSGILKPLGSEASVLNLVAEKYLTWCVSAAIIEEYLEVLKRRKFGFHPALIELWMEMAGTGFLVSPTSIIAISSDESDNRFLECAQAAEVDYLVTGNTRHFPKQWKTARIVNARQLLERLGR